MKNNQSQSHLEILATTQSKGRTFWTRVGTAFPVKNGQGYRLSLVFMPLDPSAELVMLPPKASTSDAAGEGA